MSGSTRSASTNTAALRTAKVVAPAGMVAVEYTGLVNLPAFNPDDDHGSPPTTVEGLRRQIADADAVLFCTPEYAGSLPGSFKNLLDWTVGGGELYNKPVAWINVAGPGRGGGAYGELATVLGYVNADIITAACTQLTLARDAIGPDGFASDADFRAGVAQVMHAIASHLIAGGRVPERERRP